MRLRRLAWAVTARELRPVNASVETTETHTQLHVHKTTRCHEPPTDVRCPPPDDRNPIQSDFAVYGSHRTACFDAISSLFFDFPHSCGFSLHSFREQSVSFIRAIFTVDQFTTRPGKDAALNFPITFPNRSGSYVLAGNHIARTFIHLQNKPSCLYSPAVEHHRTSAGTQFPSRVG